MKTKIFNFLILLLLFSSCRFVKDIKTYQQLDEINYDNVYQCREYEFWTLFNIKKHSYSAEYFTDSLIFKNGIDSVLFNKLELFCDTFNGRGFGPSCWHLNECFNIVAVGKMSSSNNWIRDSLKFYTNAESLINFIGPINNFDKVIFYLEAHQYFFKIFSRSNKVIKEVDNGFYCVVNKTISDCPFITRKILLFVSYEGKISEIKKGRKIRGKGCI